MTQSEYLQSAAKRLHEQSEWARKMLEKLSETEWNDPRGHQWSPGQIIQHLILAAQPYRTILVQTIASCPEATKIKEARPSWIGGKLVKLAGPGGNAPAPAPMVPGPGPYDRRVLNEFHSLQAAFEEATKTYHNRDWMGTKIRNPFVGFLVMRLIDIPYIVIAHNDRHLGQIEERLKT